MFYYKVEHWDGNETRQESGILSAKDYTEAAGCVAQYYGTEDILSIYIEEWGDFLTEDDLLEGFEKTDVKK